MGRNAVRSVAITVLLGLAVPMAAEDSLDYAFVGEKISVERLPDREDEREVSVTDDGLALESVDGAGRDSLGDSQYSAGDFRGSYACARLGNGITSPVPASNTAVGQLILENAAS